MENASSTRLLRGLWHLSCLRLTHPPFGLPLTLPTYSNHTHSGSVWIAPSSLKGFAGYGVFTTRPLAEGEHIIGRPDGVAVPVETEWDRHAPLQKERTEWSNLWGNYMYVGVVNVGGDEERGIHL